MFIVMMAPHGVARDRIIVIWLNNGRTNIDRCRIIVAWGGDHDDRWGHVVRRITMSMPGLCFRRDSCSCCKHRQSNHGMAHVEFPFPATTTCDSAALCQACEEFAGPSAEGHRGADLCS